MKTDQTKSTRQQTTKNSSQSKQTPENKNNLDSRKNKEYNLKGDDITHNKKEGHKVK
ncbi:hypothetical protein [Ferruginibacter albus]|uniref:hypothetical protein n=1 Tax=Ferruginibacter albus TaxID=2875540 RepID=UPI001CC74ACA|nr:hypothetical protein [Ferruginibacter albus]UAY52873.1 hypothetical protein K9M53_04135 [Ferruginibacter albus]